MSKTKFWIVFSIGTAAGAAIALLYAPQTGDSARKKLRRGFEDASDSLKDAGGSVRSQAGRLSDEAQGLYKKGRAGVRDGVEAASDYAGTTAKRVRSML